MSNKYKFVHYGELVSRTTAINEFLTTDNALENERTLEILLKPMFLFEHAHTLQMPVPATFDDAIIGTALKTQVRTEKTQIQTVASASLFTLEYHVLVTYPRAITMSTISYQN